MSHMFIHKNFENLEKIASENSARDELLQDASVPRLPAVESAPKVENASKLSNVLPQGFEIEKEIEGDLDADGRGGDRIVASLPPALLSGSRRILGGTVADKGRGCDRVDARVPPALLSES